MPKLWKKLSNTLPSLFSIVHNCKTFFLKFLKVNNKLLLFLLLLLGTFPIFVAFSQLLNNRDQNILQDNLFEKVDGWSLTRGLSQIWL
jgi:hypothetical protein